MIEPNGDRVIVRPYEPAKMTKGGIHLPPTAQDAPREGEVIAVGSGKLLDDGTRVKLPYCLGDRLVYSRYGGVELKIEGQDVVALKLDDVICRIKTDYDSEHEAMVAEWSAEDGLKPGVSVRIANPHSHFDRCLGYVSQRSAPDIVRVTIPDAGREGQNAGPFAPIELQIVESEAGES